MSYLETTPPSFYDLSRGWCLTIGACELEELAYEITKYCQEHGDVWQPVPYSATQAFAHRDGYALMLESWLVRLQRVRCEIPGPPRLFLNPRAKSGFQLIYPNGRVLGASFAVDLSTLDICRHLVAKSLGRNNSQ